MSRHPLVKALLCSTLVVFLAFWLILYGYFFAIHFTSHDAPPALLLLTPVAWVILSVWFYAKFTS